MQQLLVLFPRKGNEGKVKLEDAFSYNDEYIIIKGNVRDAVEFNLVDYCVG